MSNSSFNAGRKITKLQYFHFPHIVLNDVKPKIDESWLEVLADEFAQPYFANLKQTLLQEKQSGKVVYPPASLIFNAFNSTPFQEVKVVILGQDPYHRPGQAHGLSFSVPDGVPQPPSLQNIFKEINNELGVPPPSNGNLQKWAQQGVLLLNAMLTVQAGNAGSHQDIGWQQFTDAAIGKLSELRFSIVFLLWGKFAQNKAVLIDAEKHYILTSPHPSPFSVHKGFFGCGHFKRVNEILLHEGFDPINWGGK